MLANDLSERTSTVGRPSQEEFLRTRLLSVFENQPNASKPLWLSLSERRPIKQKQHTDIFKWQVAREVDAEPEMEPAGDQIPQLVLPSPQNVPAEVKHLASLRSLWHSAKRRRGRSTQSTSIAVVPRQINAIENQLDAAWEKGRPRDSPVFVNPTRPHRCLARRSRSAVGSRWTASAQTVVAAWTCGWGAWRRRRPLSR
jgi:hypothetical protein